MMYKILLIILLICTISVYSNECSSQSLYTYRSVIQNQCTSIYANFYIELRHQLVNIDGIKDLNLTHIYGHVFIRYNFVLENIDGLSNLVFIEGDLTIVGNYALTQIDALENIIIGGDLIIRDVPNLSQINVLSTITVLGEITISNTFETCSQDLVDNFHSQGFDLDCMIITNELCDDKCGEIGFKWVGKSTQMILYQECECDPELNRWIKIKFVSLKEINMQGKVVKMVPTLANAGFDLPKIYEELKFDKQTAKFLLEGTVRIVESNPMDKNTIYSYPDISIEIWFFQEDAQMDLFGRDRIIEKDSIKWTFNISHWPFDSVDNNLYLTMDIQSSNTTNSSEIMTHFPNKAIADGGIIDIIEHISLIGSHTKINLEFPYFESDLSYDPFVYLPLLMKDQTSENIIHSSSNILSSMIWGPIVIFWIL